MALTESEIEIRAFARHRMPSKRTWSLAGWERSSIQPLCEGTETLCATIEELREEVERLKATPHLDAFQEDE